MIAIKINTDPFSIVSGMDASEEGSINRRLIIAERVLLCRCLFRAQYYTQLVYSTLFSSIAIFDTTLLELLNAKSYLLIRLNGTSIELGLYETTSIQWTNLALPLIVGSKLYDYCVFNQLKNNSIIDREAYRDYACRLEYVCMLCFTHGYNPHPIGSLWTDYECYESSSIFAPINAQRPNMRSSPPTIYCNNVQYTFDLDLWTNNQQVRTNLQCLFRDTGELLNLNVYPIARTYSKVLRECVKFVDLFVNCPNKCSSLRRTDSKTSSSSSVTCCQHLKLNELKRQFKGYTHKIAHGYIDFIWSKKTHYKHSSNIERTLDDDDRTYSANQTLMGYAFKSQYGLANNGLSRRYEPTNQYSIVCLQSPLVLVKLSPKHKNGYNNSQRSLFYTEEGFLSLLYVTEGDNAGFIYSVCGGVEFLHPNSEFLTLTLTNPKKLLNWLQAICNLREVVCESWTIVWGNTLQVLENIILPKNFTLIIHAIIQITSARQFGAWDIYRLDERILYVSLFEYTPCVQLKYSRFLASPITFKALIECESITPIVNHCSVYDLAIPCISNGHLPKQMQAAKNIVHSHTKCKNLQKFTSVNNRHVNVFVPNSTLWGAPLQNIGVFEAATILHTSVNSTEDGLVSSEKFSQYLKSIEMTSFKFVILVKNLYSVHFPQELVVKKRKLDDSDELVAAPSEILFSVVNAKGVDFCYYFFKCTFVKDILIVSFDSKYLNSGAYKLLSRRIVEPEEGLDKLIVELKFRKDRPFELGDKICSLGGQKTTLTAIDNLICNQYQCDLILSLASLKRMNIGEIVFGIYVKLIRRLWLKQPTTKLAQYLHNLSGIFFADDWLQIAPIYRQEIFKTILDLNQLLSPDKHIINLFYLRMNQSAHESLAYTDVRSIERNALCGQIERGKSKSGISNFPMANFVSINSRGSSLISYNMRTIGENMINYNAASTVAGSERNETQILYTLPFSTVAVLKSLAAVGIYVNLT